MEYQICDPNEAGGHPHVQALIGKRIAGIWMLPGSVFVSFVNDAIMQVEPIKVLAGFKGGLCVKIGESKKLGFDWHTILDKTCGQDDHCVALRGMPFRGFDVDVLMFGDGFGVVSNATLGHYRIWGSVLH